MVVATIDDGYFDIGMRQAFASLHPGEACANHNDLVGLHVASSPRIV
jgi:hypothetical protein